MNGIHFLCEEHRTKAEITEVSGRLTESGSVFDAIFIDVKINSYKLNVKGKLKEKLSNLDSKLKLRMTEDGSIL